MTTAGKPIARVRVYRNHDGEGAEYLATTGRDGRTIALDQDALMGLAPDGRIGFADDKMRIRFGAKGTIRLHVTDDHGKPISGQEIFLSRTIETKQLRPYGFQWFEPNYPKELRHRFVRATDKSGNVTFSGMPKGQGFMVITHFGHMFDAELLKKSYVHDLMDVIAFQGAAIAERPAHVVIARNRELVGSVTRLSGQPMVGITVTLTDTGFGHMMGYPVKALRQAATDSSGSYRLTGLPNCLFLVMASGAREPYVIESKAGNGKWQVESIQPKGSWTDGRILSLQRPQSRCDFRISAPAHIHVQLRNPANVSLADCFVDIGSEGRAVDKSGSVDMYVSHGHYVVSFSKTLDDDWSKKLGEVTVSEGEETTLTFNVPPRKAHSFKRH